MKQKGFLHILTLIGIILLTLTLLTGTAAADHTFDISDDKIIIQKNASANSLDIIHDGATTKNIPLSEMITIKQSGAGETTNVIIINGDDIIFDNSVNKAINITLEEVRINCLTKTISAMSLNNATVNLTLNGSNSLTGGSNLAEFHACGYSGIEVPEGCELTIISLNNDPTKGNLVATGAAGKDDDTSGKVIPGGGAGIGGIGMKNAGKITIIDSNITAIGGNGLGCGGGSGIGGGGSKDNGTGCSANSIIIKNSIVTAKGGNGDSNHGKGAGIGGGGGKEGGDAFNIRISGEQTDIIVTNGGIGGGFGVHPDCDGEGNIVIDSGNVLTLEQPNEANNVFKNGIGEEIYPISFTVMDNEDDKNPLPGVSIKSGSYTAMTREDASTRVGSANDWYAPGTVTMWLPTDGTTQSTFYFLNNSENRTGNELVNSPRPNIVGGNVIDIYLNELDLIQEKKGGGSGTGSAKVVDGNDTNKTTQQNNTSTSPNSAINDSPNSNENKNENTNQNSGDNGYENKTEPKTSKSGWIIAGIGLIAIAGIAGAYFYRKNK
ncbi:hypothetical protein [Methanimicrococcus blatticola]|uniref:Uncharacterized protein n=1 Tax=Methanimicrococcus blatticola TaxID=91560 RepID=A0A484F509_9EURY|nr:hypothetical protein [Methanimicrococcus blatticola]MBZ3936064.1 hypothetical protein [Methanimicrococcus blatticola]MCC2509325.1 hypothetical protein [Methanimicrococcus blatticola]TDQ68211.1 hypothetical protein C7391_1149 [Methanimicrococcus blatticola]